MIKENAPKLKVNALPLKNGIYHSRVTFGMSFVSIVADERTTVSNTISCRERLICTVREAVSGKNDLASLAYDYYKKDKNPPIDLDKTRLLIINTELTKETDIKAFKERLFAGKKLLNFYEYIAGWPQTKITTVCYEYAKVAFLITGPGMWMKSPFYLSLFTLILRSSAFTEGISFEKETIEDRTKEVESYWEKIISNYMNTANDVPRFIADNQWKKFMVMMREWRQLIPEKITDAYPDMSIVGRDTFSGCSGTYTLFKANTYSPEINKIASNLFQ